MSARLPAHRRGFTLLEVVIAIAVLTIMAALAWETIGGAMRARDYLAFEEELDRSGRIAMARVHRELSLAFLTKNTAAVNTYRTVFVGKDDNDTDQIWFASRSHRPSVAGARESDQTEITIWCEPDPENRNRMMLLHREAQRVDHEPDKDGVILPLARDVSRFDLRYLDPLDGEWQDSWDTNGADTPGRLPRAVQIVLTIAKTDPEDEDDVVERTFVSTVMIEGASRLARSATASDGGAGRGRLSGGGGGGGGNGGGGGGNGGGGGGSGGGKGGGGGGKGGGKK